MKHTVNSNCIRLESYTTYLLLTLYKPLDLSELPYSPL